MNKNFVVSQIGVIHVNDDGFYLKINDTFKNAVIGLEDFNYINVVWWFSECDNEESKRSLVENKPYKKGPEELGVFATRSPSRPNPIAISSSYVTSIDVEQGIIGLAYIDAFDGTPVLDIKPYIPSVDRVEEVVMPSWCNHWPQNVESSGEFNWEEEFNF